MRAAAMQRRWHHAFRRDGRIRTSWKRYLVSAILLLLVALVGAKVALRWPSTESDYYATVSQVIATLFIAIVLEAFTHEEALWEDDTDRFLVLTLLATSLFGLFVCIRGLLGAGGPTATGIAASGLIAASILVCLALLRRLQSALPTAPATLLLIFASPPVLALVIF